MRARPCRVRPSRFGAALLLGVGAAPHAAADDWPQWRGPRGDNVSLEREWSSVGREAPLWRARIGTGYSSPVVAGGRLFIAGYFEEPDTPGEGFDRVSCLDARTGAELWRVEYPALAFANEHAGGALGTPTVAGELLIVPTRQGGVRALALSDGELRWQVDLVERHGVSPGRYGFASSALQVGELLVLNAARTVALELETGETAWISEDHDANYSTVAPIALGERAGLAVFGGRGLFVIDARDGTDLRQFEFRKTPRNVEGATPIVMGTRAFVSSAYEQGGALVDFAPEEPELVWRTRKMRNKMAGCTLYEGHLYGFDESILKCLDLEGNERWRERGLGQGALSIAGGRLLFTSSSGELLVARATPEGYQEEARRAVIDGGVFWSAPLLSDGLVYVRGSLGDLVCLDHRSGRPVAEAEEGAREGPAELPAAAELVARHLEATGLDAGLPAGLRMSGKLHIDALGIANSDAFVEFGGEDLWRARFDLPPGIGGAITRTFDGRFAWESNPYRGNKLIDDHRLVELRRTRGMRTLFEPLPADGEARVVGLESFQGRPCVRVDVALTPERTRSVWFDAGSGLLAGRTCEDEATVVFEEWRRAGELLLPFHQTSFDPESGEEQRWRFEEAEVVELDDEAVFTPPEDLAEALEALRRSEQEGD